MCPRAYWSYNVLFSPTILVYNCAEQYYAELLVFPCTVPLSTFIWMLFHLAHPGHVKQRYSSAFYLIYILIPLILFLFVYICFVFSMFVPTRETVTETLELLGPFPFLRSFNFFITKYFWQFFSPLFLIVLNELLLFFPPVVSVYAVLKKFCCSFVHVLWTFHFIVYIFFVRESLFPSASILPSSILPSSLNHEDLLLLPLGFTLYSLCSFLSAFCFLFVFCFSCLLCGFFYDVVFSIIRCSLSWLELDLCSHNRL